MNNHVITEPALDWLEDPEVFAVNRLEAHSDHKIYGRKVSTEHGSFRMPKIQRNEKRIFSGQTVLWRGLTVFRYRDTFSCRGMTDASM